MKLIDICYTIIARLLLLLICIAFAPLILVIFFLPERYRWRSGWVYRLVNCFYWLVLRCSLLPITIYGMENLPTEPAIFVANHQSSLDIPLLGVLANGHPHVWLARSELLNTIVLRHILPTFAVVADVTSLRAAMLSLRRIINTLIDHSAHLMIFPEGSRSIDGEIQPFFDGFVIVAKKLGRLVIPVYIHNVNRVYPRNTLWLQWHSITVIIGQPFFLSPDESEKAFSDRVRAWFLQQKKEFF